MMPTFMTLRNGDIMNTMHATININTSIPGTMVLLITKHAPGKYWNLEMLLKVDIYKMRLLKKKPRRRKYGCVAITAHSNIHQEIYVGTLEIGKMRLFQPASKEIRLRYVLLIACNIPYHTRVRINRDHWYYSINSITSALCRLKVRPPFRDTFCFVFAMK